MGTVMTWARVQFVAPGVRRQTVRVPRLTARASAVPSGPGVSVAVRGGSGGSSCQEDPVLAMISPWRAVVMTATVPPEPKEAEASAAPCRGNLLHLARMLKDAGGIPAHGNQRSGWDAGCRYDFDNPEYR